MYRRGQVTSINCRRCYKYKILEAVSRLKYHVFMIISGFHVRHGGHVGAHLQKNFNELLLLCAPTWPSWLLSFESHRTEGHVSENHL